ncbi:diguanylate cyclase [Thioalkalivibrio denitrificans]|uniref:diguanylate cyclase n=1 Tax=Thioalkalivibrio denitrificans TaxID=108003 RepID=A0A1V3NRY8_9GAMM|nr:diguanylate cyclase [Thioalkalivibrio denitrificans]OOG27723.1 diguanylate cyclase [Thioalkalivibrio denitrificans]
MTSLSDQQLQSVISNLEMAYRWHDQWYKNLLRTFIARIPPNPSDLTPDSHLRCCFGQWYQRAPIELLDDQPSFSELGAKHEKMHSLATGLLRRISDDRTIALRDWDQFQSAVDDMRTALQLLQKEFARMAQGRDPLTGAQNRAIMRSDLLEQHALVQRGVTTCALAMLDLDLFKSINDNLGHPAGDAVLVATVQCVKAVVRPYDRIYRYGGEEFLICMPGVNSDQSRELAERIREAIAAQKIQLEDVGQCVQVTASIGVSMLSQSRSIEESVGRADKAMYKAKAAGRNLVVVDV